MFLWLKDYGIFKSKIIFLGINKKLRIFALLLNNLKIYGNGLYN